MTEKLVFVQNDGADIIKTNYWEIDHAQRGLFYVSINAGTFRLLVPAFQEGVIAEMATAKVVIISRGPWPDKNRDDAFEFLFEDHSNNPFSLFMVPGQFILLPRDSDCDQPGQPPSWRFAAWTQDGKKLELPCRYRLVNKIPCLKKFPEG